MRTVLLIAALVMSLLASAVRADSGQFEDLGPQITSKLLQGSAFTHDPSGRLLVCTVIRGAPGKFVVIDANTGKVEHVFPLKDAHGAWNATTATDGSVYTGTDPGGEFFRYVPGEDHLRELGVAIDTWVWDVCAGKDGEVFIATYPKAMVVRYHPKDGFSDVAHGGLVDGENYARSISYHAATDTLYIGIGSHAHLVKLNPRTGEKTDITPAEVKPAGFAYTVDCLGDYLLVRTTPDTGAFLYEMASMKRIATFKNSVITHCSTKSPDSPAIYFTGNNQLRRVDPTGADPKPVAAARVGDGNAFYWDDARTLRIFNRAGKIYTVHFPPGDDVKSAPAVTSIDYDAPEQLTLLQSTYAGPDGRIWTGGYLSGGAAAFDPATGKHVQYGTVGQPEEMNSIGKSMVFGCYPAARLWIYDTTAPWNAKDTNPEQYAELESIGQSRPVAMLGVESLHTVFTGTVAEYGLLDGALAGYDTQTKKVTTWRDVVHNQSIISLVYSDGLLIGGTSIAGGLGQSPTEKEGKLFIFDPATGKKIFEIVPVTGKQIVGALTIGADHRIWGLAGGTLFIFDLPKRQVIATHELVADDNKGPQWRAGRLIFHPNGKLYVTTQHDFLSVDLATFKPTMLRQGGTHHAALDAQGRIYFVAGETNLWRYTP